MFLKSLKSKNNGITLIALIITIIVILVIVGATINLIINGGLFDQANKAKEEMSSSEAMELAEMADAEVQMRLVKANQERTYENVVEILSGQDGMGYESSGDGTFTKNGNAIKVERDGKILPASLKQTALSGKLKPGEKSAKTEKDNYTDGKKTATIPEEFTVSDKDGEKEIDEGLVVIAPDGSEFVWVPVPSPSEMYGTLSDGRQAGKLYTNWTATESDPLNWTETDNVMSITTPTGYREPDVISGSDVNERLEIIKGILTDEESKVKYADADAFKQTMQDDFDTMIESVKIYEGFYVGRYETSLDSSKKAQSKYGEKSATAEETSANTWYGFYARQKEYSTSSVQGSMIWGTQWDRMLKWMQTNDDIDVSSVTPIENAEANTQRTTGTQEGDKILNIYDLLGNSYEWTLEAYSTIYRSHRGGYYYLSAAPAHSYPFFPQVMNDYRGSRLSLYIKY